MKRAVIVVTMGILSLGGWSGCSSPPPPAREGGTGMRPSDAPVETLAPPPPAELSAAIVEEPGEPPLVTEIIMIEGSAPVVPTVPAAENTADTPISLVPIFAASKPKLLEMPVPVFPENVDFETVFPGWVELEIELEVDGSVLGVEVLDASSPELWVPLKQAASGARYTVARDPNGVAVRVTFRDRIEL